MLKLIDVDSYPPVTLSVLIYWCSVGKKVFESKLASRYHTEWNLLFNNLLQPAQPNICHFFQTFPATCFSFTQF